MHPKQDNVFLLQAQSLAQQGKWNEIPALLENRPSLKEDPVALFWQALSELKQGKEQKVIRTRQSALTTWCVDEEIHGAGEQVAERNRQHEERHHE